MNKYEVRYTPDNIFIIRRFSRDYISRVIARVEGWQKEIYRAKREIFQEALKRGLLDNKSR